MSLLPSSLTLGGVLIAFIGQVTGFKKEFYVMKQFSKNGKYSFLCSILHHVSVISEMVVFLFFPPLTPTVRAEILDRTNCRYPHSFPTTISDEFQLQLE